MSSLTIAIPAYNEAVCLEGVVRKARTDGLRYTQDLEILIVDDGSTDQTGAIADRLAAEFPQVRVIHHKKNMGFTGAIKNCYRSAAKSLIFLIPADGQVDSSELPKFTDLIGKFDVVVGYRLNQVESPIRRINSVVFHLLYRGLFGVPLREISTAILWKKSILDKISIRAKARSAMIEPEVIYKAWMKGAKLTQVGITYHKRSGGKAKGANLGMITLTLSEMFRLWWMLRVKK